MIQRSYKLFTAGVFLIGAGSLLAGLNPGSANHEPSTINADAQHRVLPKHPDPKSESGNLVIQLCDGQTEMEVAGVRAAEALPPRKARKVARRLMVAYAEEQAKQVSKWTKQARLVWQQEQDRLKAEGYRLFHDWKAVGGTNGISCDMCHPDAADTHPETYPKFQTQLKNVVALREMINWCIEKPMKGQPLACDDLKMLALEMYITSQRKGVPLDPGKH